MTNWSWLGRALALAAPAAPAAAQSSEPFDRFRAIAKNAKARVIIQHEPGDIAKLPQFPEAEE